MGFMKYQHVERFGSVETEGIDHGLCYVFPKIDGTNGQIWWNNGLHAGSRNRELTVEDDNAGFFTHVRLQQCYWHFFQAYPNLRLFGEWLVPHTLRTYQEKSWKHFYVFDVMHGGSYIPYDEYKPMVEEFGIEYVPPICKIKNPTYDRLVAQLDKNFFLISDGMGTGEGVVIKNYDYKNKFGRTTWAKIVKNEFKTSHQKIDVTELKEKKIIELEIVSKYVTPSLVEKEYAKICNDGGWSSKQIPRLLNTVFYCLITEDTWNFIKDFKNPTIDFKRLSVFTTSKIKELMPNLF